jgi:CHAT domain-containing protein
MSTRPSLPPQVLVTSDPLGKALKDVDWLIRRHAVTILPSIASLKVLRGRTATSSAPKPLIGFADPVFNKNQQPPVRRVATNVMVTKAVRGGVADVLNLVTALDPLPETADELQRVAESVGATEADIILGPKATETRVKQTRLEDYRIIYFATHGLLAGEVAKLAKLNAEPALVLSLPDTPTAFDDGLLTASEAAQPKLNAEWVVLSACNTAAGDGSGAEALSGLARAFFYAGGRGLLVSHWPVKSSAAVKLTTTPVTELKAHPEIGRAEALRRAMLALMQDKSDLSNAHPAIWAPFMMVGEGGSDPDDE